MTTGVDEFDGGDGDFDGYEGADEPRPDGAIALPISFVVEAGRLFDLRCELTTSVELKVLGHEDAVFAVTITAREGEIHVKAEAPLRLDAYTGDERHAPKWTKVEPRVWTATIPGTDMQFILRTGRGFVSNEEVRSHRTCRLEVHEDGVRSMVRAHVPPGSASTRSALQVIVSDSEDDAAEWFQPIDDGTYMCAIPSDALLRLVE